MGKEMLRIRLEWMQPEYTGPLTPCHDIDPSKDVHIPTENELYPKRTIRVGLPKDCKACYLSTTVEWEKVKSDLKKFDRTVNATPMDGNCCYNACVQQVSHPDKYDGDDLRKHSSYFFAKYPEVIEPHVKEGLAPHCVRSWIVNMFEGRMFGDVISLTCIAVMWNVAITVVTPQSPPLHIFHNKTKSPDIVLVHNGKKGSEGHFTSTGT